MLVHVWELILWTRFHDKIMELNVEQKCSVVLACLAYFSALGC